MFKYRVMFLTILPLLLMPMFGNAMMIDTYEELNALTGTLEAKTTLSKQLLGDTMLINEEVSAYAEKCNCGLGLAVESVFKQGRAVPVVVAVVETFSPPDYQTPLQLVDCDLSGLHISPIHGKPARFYRQPYECGGTVLPVNTVPEPPALFMVLIGMTFGIVSSMSSKRS